MNSTTEQIEPIAQQVVAAMLRVHRALGPGLLKSAVLVAGCIIIENKSVLLSFLALLAPSW